MDPLRHSAAVMPVVSAVAVGMVVSAGTRVMVVGGVSSAGAPRGPQHLELKTTKMKIKQRQKNMVQKFVVVPKAGLSECLTQGLEGPKIVVLLFNK